MVTSYLIPYATELLIYAPFFALAFLGYYLWPTSVWRKRLIECLILANGVGAGFLILIGTVILKVVQPDLVTIVSITITLFDAFYTGKFNAQKPKISKNRGKPRNTNRTSSL